MFHKVIHLKRVNEIRYGTTNISYEQTFGQIMALLRKHGCTKIATMEDEQTGEAQIAFELSESAYVVTIPKVYVNKILNRKIGIRIVFRFFETLLEMVKQRAIDIDFLMLGSRLVDTPRGRMTLKEAADSLPAASIFKDMVALPEGGE